MRGWIILAMIAGGIYYFATETDKLDKPIDDIKSLLNKVDRKFDSMTGTKIIRVDKYIPQMKKEIYDRLSAIEIRELDGVFTSDEAISEFKKQYCHSGVHHPVFTKDNLQYICDKL